MRLAGTKLAANHQYRGFGDQLYDLSGERPSLDLNFSSTKSLVDSTTGQNLVTFTRASSGTYVDSQGVIRTATTNLLLRSEEFNDASWTKNALQAFGSGSVANSIAAPNGTLAADYLAENTSLSEHFAEQNFTALAGLTYTFSVYVKAGPNKTNVTLRFSTTAWGGAVSNQVRFNLINGAITVISGTGTGAATQLNDGWWRFSITATSTANGSPSVRVHLIENNGTSANYTGDGTSGIYLWGAQLEQSSTVGEYIPTTSTINSAPRFDHNPTTGESLGLLVEESRTNLLLHSACDSNWPSGGFGTATYNLGLSALGVFSGVQIASAGQNWHSIYRTGISLTASTVYAFTLFYRAGTSGRVRLTFRNNTTSTETVINGLAGNLSVSGSFAGAATVLSQFLCLDGLTYVVTGTFTPNGTSVDHWYRIGPDSTTSGQTVIALGGQLEAGSFPTSYIPTTTAAVTRAADVASITGSNFSSWYRQDEGTVFASARTNATHGGTNSFPRIHTISDGTNDNAIGNYFRVLSTYTDAGYGVTTLTVTQATFDTNNERNGQSVSTVYANNDFAFAAGGSVVSTDNTGTVPAVSQLRLGARGTGLGPLNGTIRRLTYWPQRLPNSTLQQITQ